MRAARKADRSIRDHSMQPHRHLADVRGNAGHLGAAPDLLDAGVARATDVFQLRAGEQAAVLGYRTNLAAHRPGVEFRQIHAVVVHAPGERALDTEQQLEQS